MIERKPETPALFHQKLDYVLQIASPKKKKKRSNRVENLITSACLPVCRCVVCLSVRPSVGLSNCFGRSVGLSVWQTLVMQTKNNYKLPCVMCVCVCNKSTIKIPIVALTHAWLLSTILLSILSLNVKAAHFLVWFFVCQPRGSRLAAYELTRMDRFSPTATSRLVLRGWKIRVSNL